MPEIPLNVVIEARKPGKMRDPMSEDTEAIDGKGYGYPTHFGYPGFGHPAPSHHHGHHFASGGYEYGSSGGHHYSPQTLPPFDHHHHHGYGFGHYGASEFDHGFSHGAGAVGYPYPKPEYPGQMFFGQIGQGNINGGFPVGYAGYGNYLYLLK